MSLVEPRATAGAGNSGDWQEQFSNSSANNQIAITAQATIAIERVTIGERHRRDLGDLDSLAQSMADLGILQPIAILTDGTLVGGARRLAAAKLNGWTHIPVHVVNIDEVINREFAENVHRKNFTPPELVAIGEAVERVERERARERKAHDGRPGKLPERQTGDARDKIAAQLGISGRTYEKAKAVVAAAEAEPEKFGKLVTCMDRTGRVNGMFKRLKVFQQAGIIRAEPPPLPGNGPYRVISIDFPWKNDVRADDPSHRTNSPFPEMSIDAICRFEIRSIATPDGIVWLWATNHQILNSIHKIVLDAQGLKPRSLLTWVKTNRIGTGDWLRGQTEHCIMATWGNPVVRGHSVKPPEFYDLVERLCPAPRYADLFSRYRHNERWDCHGDEAPGDDGGAP